MKRIISFLLMFFPSIFLMCNAQDKGNSLNLSTDLVSSFVWRGTKIGAGPAIQPTLEFSAGGLALGAWGSYYFTGFQDMETDLYASYSFDFGLSIGMNDYYFPTTPFFDENNHAFELQGNLRAGKFSFSANYVLNEGGGAAGRDVYFELGLEAGKITLFTGAGNGWHTPDNKFAVCNLGLSTTKDIRITDSFSLPLSGSLILNPRTERLYVVVGITL